MMTEQEQNFALLEACGKKVCTHGPTDWQHRGPEGDRELFCIKCANYLSHMRVPDIDLDFMHEAEKQFWPVGSRSWNRYIDRLVEATNGSEENPTCATVAQRREAFLLAKWLWR